MGYTFGKSRAEKLPPPVRSNESQRFDFEASISDSISLDICDAIPPTFYENCYRASSKLYLSRNGFTGKHGLGYHVELLPSRERVYSVNIPINPPALVDAVSANIFIPESVSPYKIWLLVKLNGEDNWKLSEISGTSSGWIYLYLDLQDTYDATGLPVSHVVVDEVDIDVFFPKGDQQSVTFDIEIDDVALYFPASNILELP